MEEGVTAVTRMDGFCLVKATIEDDNAPDRTAYILRCEANNATVQTWLDEEPDGKQIQTAIDLFTAAA